MIPAFVIISGSQGNRKIDESKEADGRGCKTILDTRDMRP